MQWKGCGHQSWFLSDHILLRAEQLVLFSEKDAEWRARLNFDFFFVFSFQIRIWSNVYLFAVEIHVKLLRLSFSPSVNACIRSDV